MRELKIGLEGLDCAHCGSKIEEKAGKIQGVQNSALNFINKTLTIDYDNIFEQELFNKVSEIVNKLEPQVKVTLIKENIIHEHSHKMEHSADVCSCENHSHNHENSCDCGDNCGCHGHEEACLCDSSHDEHKHDKHHDNGHSHDSDNSKAEKIKLIVGAVIFVGAIIIHNQFEMLSVVLSLIAYAVVGYDILWIATKNIIRGQIFDENFLMSIASIGAIIIGEYPEAAGVMLFYKTGEYFQSLAVNKSRKQIKDLLNIKSEYANLKTESGIVVTKPELIKKGDVIIVKPGEKIPLDGVVIEGNSTVDASALTGESMPIDVDKNSEVISGSINQSGVLTIEVSKPFKESTVSKILYLVEKAGNKKSQAENFITKFAKYYTPTVVGLAVLIAVVPPFIIKDAIAYDWIYKGLIFLVISCPCALVLSIPLTYFSGLGCASKNGILIKGGNYLEALSDAEIAVFDKTGTLTEGKFAVNEIYSCGEFSYDDVLKLSAYCELYSNHPISASVKAKYNQKIDENKIFDYKEISGHGITARIDNQNVVLGNLKLMAKEGIDVVQAKDKPGTVLYLAVDKKYAGYMVIADKIKENSTNLVRNLKSAGIKNTVMLSGDNKASANYVKTALGLDEVYAELLPQDKIEQVEKLFEQKSHKGKLIFVGDGINDAPVLMRADIGFAMGGVGSDAAIESADAVIMNDDPQKVVVSIQIAKKTKAIVWQNIIFALSVKLIVMFLDVFATVPMTLAVFADVGVALLAVLNASKILRMKF